MTLHFFNGVTLTLYEILLIFFTYGFLGWCAEVAFATLKTGTFVNRGFLNGPICPIYGFGMVIVVILLTPLTGSISALFFGSMVLTTALEFFTGWVLEKLFHTKWWDYTDRKFNLKGYICLEFSILWGLACLCIMRILHPVIMNVLHWIPHKVGLVLLAMCIVLMIVDLAATITAIRGLQKRLHTLTAMAEEIHDFSDDLGGGISGAVQVLKVRTDEDKAIYDQLSALVEQHLAEEKALSAEHRKEEQLLLEQLTGEAREARAARQLTRQNEFREKLLEPHRAQQRIIRAFPSMHLREDQDALDTMRHALEEHKQHKGQDDRRAS